MIYRQGDVLIKRVNEIPKGLKSRRDKKTILAYGEVTGHHHRFQCGNVTTFYKEGDAEVGAQPMSGGAVATDVAFISVSGDGASLLHEEHSTIDIPPGDYEIIRQREYDVFEGVRRVAD